MSRIVTNKDDPLKPRIEPDHVASFFEERARRIATLGPVRAVLYQDNDPDLAERRDHEERRVLAPLLAVDASTRFLDIGCGTGRWVPSVAGTCAHYHGIDLSPGLIEFARVSYADHSNCRFSVCSATELSLASLQEALPFDRILCAGLFIYLNDEDVHESLQRIADVGSARCRIVLREPMALADRLTIQDHFSEDLNQTYNAIYRSESEIRQLAEGPLVQSGFCMTRSADLFLDQTLNNRQETRQRWMLWERRA